MTRVLWCVLGCRQELPLCAQVIFFPGVSGQGLAFFKHMRAMWCGGTVLFQEMRQCPFGEQQTLVSPLEEQWNTLQRCCVWSMFMSALGQWGGMNVTQHKKWVWLWEKWGGPSRHPWHSPLIKTRWHGEEKDWFTGGVYSSIWSQKEPRPLWVQEKVGWSHLRGVGGGIGEVQWERTHCVGVLFDIKAR